MKKLLVLLVVLAVATVANAGIKISVGGVVDPPDTSIMLMPSETVAIGIYGDGQTVNPVNLWLITQGPGSNMGAGALLDPAMDMGFVVHYTDDGEGILSWLGSVGFPTMDAYFVSLASSAAPPPMITGECLGDAVFHCDAPGEVTLSLVEIFDDGEGNITITPYDTQVIHQIPEPMTLGLLGLGGLFLRRRK
jgi:hypothetical protein